ncbi:sensor histidine kinase [Paeniglutamicibacter sp. ORCA_105]|uniref:sensor histidine kinase n=1 Tax=Paeniglutamicibacter sp. ORCA_105 TaxID=3377336 RepID=UPI0038933B01
MNGRSSVGAGIPDPLQPTKLLFHLRRLGPRARIGLCHLPLTVVLTFAMIAATVASPILLERELVVAGLAGHGMLILAAWLVPWERLPHGAPLLIPVCDLVVIGLLHNGASDILRGLAALAVFPVIWLSVSGMFPWAAAIISFVGPLAIMAASVPLLSGATGTQLTSMFLLPLMLLAVSLAIRSVAGNVAVQQRQLERQDRELRELLNSSIERERLLGTVLDTVDVGIVAVDAQGKTILSNEWLRQLTRRTAAQATAEEGLVLLGQDREAVLPVDKHPIRRAVNGEEFGDYVVWTGTGNEQRALGTAARSMRGRDGGFGGAVIAFSDVTGLYEAVSAKDELIANVSHDLRAPLTSIFGNLELVLDQLDIDAEATLGSMGQYLRYSHHSAERLLELVSDLLLSASAATTIHPRKTDLAGLVQSCVGAVRPQAQAAKVSIVTDFPSPLWAHADPARIAQVVDNLISNAIKYSPDGGEVRVTATSNGREAILEVRDSGLGISPHDVSRVFDKFFRSNEVRDAAIPGTGLGLSIAKAIVDRHGGSIQCTSTPGEGTSMNVTLPVEPALA